MANVRELAGPWSSKFFIFHRPKTRENISSIVVRLPDGAPDQPGSYWAFSLQPLFGNCQLEYITDLQKLSSDYKYAAKHPMVGDPCSRAVFDPLQMADLPGGAWARGAIVRGYAFRLLSQLKSGSTAINSLLPQWNRDSRTRQQLRSVEVPSNAIERLNGSRASPGPKRVFGTVVSELARG